MDIGPWELLIVLAVVLLLFGGAKLPKLARGMGEASREYKRAAQGDDAEPGAGTSKPD